MEACSLAGITGGALAAAGAGGPMETTTRAREDFHTRLEPEISVFRLPVDDNPSAAGRLQHRAHQGRARLC
jgi:hypothetical protein